MEQTYSFKFMNEKLNQHLLSLLTRAKVSHVVDKAGVIHYSVHDEEIVGNELIRSIRNQVFPVWQLLSCPKDWTERYKRYMAQHHVEFSEELINNQVCFLLPRKYRPHAWNLGRLEDPVKNYSVG